ncbi:MAG: hypothetical protein ACNA8W_23955 [Bradymonadaceae bacterium]
MKPLIYRLFMAALLFAVVFTLGCKTMSSEKKDFADPRALPYSVNEFHKELRWARYEQASMFLDESYRHSFLGRYEELGDDFRIVELELKSMKFEEEHAEVEVEQQWYVEPEMIVKTERYIEIWKPDSGAWRLQERTEKEAWRKEKEEERRNAPKDSESLEPLDSLENTEES